MSETSSSKPMVRRHSMRWSGREGDLAMHPDTNGQWCHVGEVEGLESEIRRLQKLLEDRRVTDETSDDLQLCEHKRIQCSDCGVPLVGVIGANQVLGVEPKASTP